MAIINVKICPICGIETLFPEGDEYVCHDCNYRVGKENYKESNPDLFEKNTCQTNQ